MNPTSFLLLTPGNGVGDGHDNSVQFTCMRPDKTDPENPPNAGDRVANLFTSTSQVTRINTVFSAFLIFGFVTVWQCANEARHVGPAMMWALACLGIGAVVGLLFGIPRMRQKQAGPKGEGREDNSKYQPEINNNLIEVSDWLTKIIVGVGLIELTSLPENLKRAARPLEACLGSQCAQASAVGIIVYFIAAGFLVGYINARTFIAVLFRRSDDELLEEKVSELASKVERNVVKQEAEQVTSNIKLQGMRSLFEATTPAAASAVESVATTQPDPGLLQMAKDYEAINDNSYRVRVAKKDRAAAAMVRYIVNSKFSKDTLLAWVEGTPSDGMILAYASVVLSFPERADVSRLLKIARHAQWLHVKFRVTLAFRSLCIEGHGTPEEWNEVMRVLESYKDHAQRRDDSSLVTLTQEVLALISARNPQQ